jgi:hypothetical protein
MEPGSTPRNTARRDGGAPAPRRSPRLQQNLLAWHLYRAGFQVAGAKAVLAHHPHDRPEKLKRGPAPLFHAATAEMRTFLWSLYAEFVGRFRDAAEKLRAGDRNAVFPPGCFPPALPFVPGQPSPAQLDPPDVPREQPLDRLDRRGVSLAGRNRLNSRMRLRKSAPLRRHRPRRGRALSGRKKWSGRPASLPIPQRGLTPQGWHLSHRPTALCSWAIDTDSDVT